MVSMASWWYCTALGPVSLRKRRRNLWVGWCVTSWWALFPSRSSVLIYMHFLYEVCYRTYIYMQLECHSILAKLHPIAFYRTVFLGSAQFLGWMPLFFFFFWFTNCVLLSDDNNLVPRCLWHLPFILNNTLILGIWCSTIPHLPECFCPWTVFQKIGFNMVPSDPFMSHLATQLGYSAGEFQALQLIVLATVGDVD